MGTTKLGFSGGISCHATSQFGAEWILGAELLGRGRRSDRWSTGYWRAAVAQPGGALVFVGFCRVFRGAQIRDALLLAIGLALLANSRPYEGLLFSLPTAVVLLVWICTRQRADFRVAMTRIVLPLFVIVTLAGIAMVFYNLSGTGSLFLTPYQVHEATYG